MAKRKTKNASKTAVSAAAAQMRMSPTEGMSVSQQVSWWSLLAMIFITPLIISNLSIINITMPISYDQFDIIKVFSQRVFTLIALAAWAWHLFLNGGKVRRTPVDWAILAFLGWVLLSTIFSIHPPTALFGKYRRFEGLFSFINYAVIYFLVLQFADRPSRVKRIAQTIFWTGTIVTGYGVLQYLGRDPFSWGNLPFESLRAFSTYGNPDLLGGFLMFSNFISIALALAERNLWMRAVYWAGSLLSLLCTVVAFTRSAWVGSIVGFVFIVLFAVYQRAEWKKEDWIFSGATAALVVGVIFKSLSNTNAVMNFAERFKSIFQFGAGSALTRFEIWEAAINAVTSSPFRFIFGFGPDTFRLVFPQYKPIEYVRDAGYLSVADNVHNYPLQLATGIGVIGVLALYAIFGWAAVRSWKIVFNRDGNPNRMLLAGFWTAAAAYIAHLFFGLSVTGSSFLLWVCIAVVLAPTATSINVRPPSWGIFGALGVVALALVGIGFQVVYMQADHAYLFSRIGTQGAARTAYAKEAVRLNPWNDMYRAEVGLALTDELLGQVNQLATTQDPALQQQLLTSSKALFDQAEASLLDTIEFVPDEYDNYVFLANLYTLGGQIFSNPDYYQKAVEIGRRGIEVERYGPAVRFQTARALDQLGRRDEAIKELQYAHDMDHAYIDATMLLVELYEEAGEPEKALKALKETDIARPGQSNVLEAIKRIEASSTATP